MSDLRNNEIAQNLIFILRKARPGTQRDRPLMRPVTAPCDHDPPSRFPVGTRSPRLDPPDKASDRPLMRPVTVALSSLPCPETDLRSYHYDCPSLSRAGGAKRAAGPGPSGPSEHRDRGAKVRSRISGESEPPVRRANESLSVCVFASTATSIPRSGMRGAGRGSRWRRSNATSQGRHPTNSQPTKNSEVM